MMGKLRTIEKSRTIILMIIIFIGIISRLYNLGQNSYWYDEASSIILAQHISTIHKQLGTDAPLFFVLLNLWLYLGKSEFILRLLPALIGILTLPLLFYIFRNIVDAKTAFYATAFLALSPFHIYYAQELRGYTLLPFLFLLCTHFFIRALKRSKRADWLLFSIFSALSLYTHYFALFSLFANFLFLLVFIKEYKHRIGNFILFNFLTLILYSPWLLVFLKRTLAFEKYSKFWILQPKYKDLAVTIKNFIIGYGAPKWAFYISAFIGIALILKAMPLAFKDKN
ncbi:glycosyltransferase family 39 protein, partial [bacterium]|nr:glycosyltransferase family 39 protein [bacterium]